MSAPPMENNEFQQMPPVPPSYDQAMAAAPPGQLPYPPVGPQNMYPPLPQEKGGVPPANYQPPPPPAGYPGAAPAPGPAPNTTTVINQVRYVAGPSFGYRPVTMTCPTCQATITTKTEEDSSPMAWIICLACCLFGFWPCACVPFCMDSMKQVTHTCPVPTCKVTLGRYKGGL